MHLRHLDSMPRSEIAQKRIALAKLQKDFEKVKIGVQALVNESSLIQVQPVAGAASDGFSRTGGNGSESSGFDGPSSGGQQQMQAPRFIQTLQGQDVDDAIMEERERDIRKMNQDLAMVNEMFRYVQTLFKTNAFNNGIIITSFARETHEHHHSIDAAPLPQGYGRAG